jgi:hypothetical protein
VNWAASLAAVGRCAVLLKQHWDAWAAMLAAALLAALRWAQLQPVCVGPIPSGNTNRSDSGSAGGLTSDGSQQQQQRPCELRRLGQAAFELASAAQLLLPPATAGLGTLQRNPVPLLMNSLGKHCSIGSVSLLRYVEVLAS